MAPPKVRKGGAKVSFGPPQSGKTKKYLLDQILANNSNEDFEIVEKIETMSSGLFRTPKLDEN